MGSFNGVYHVTTCYCFIWLISVMGGCPHGWRFRRRDTAHFRPSRAREYYRSKRLLAIPRSRKANHHDLPGLMDLKSQQTSYTRLSNQYA
ncbi:hypothetical protein F4859DRAFT_486627 [Xylaria cf. heliscus]|nr:hypothetical protein F4859DRAFT_486627 [Xylaria cf. heliscus]